MVFDASAPAVGASEEIGRWRWGNGPLDGGQESENTWGWQQNTRMLGENLKTPGDGNKIQVS